MQYHCWMHYPEQTIQVYLYQLHSHFRQGVELVPVLLLYGPEFLLGQVIEYEVHKIPHLKSEPQFPRQKGLYQKSMYQNLCLLDFLM